MKGKKPFPLRKYALLAVVLVLVGRTVWNVPRRGWSLKEDVRRTGLFPKTGLSPKNIRNVVLISIDTCRADHLGCYGYSRKTSPNIDAVAAEGILFNHAVTPVPITLPSHSSMLTGTTPLYHKVRDNNNYRLSDSNVTLAEILRENGFITGAVIGAFVMDSQFGLDQGFDTYNDDLGGKSESFLLYNERKAEEVTHLANIWLEKHHYDKFFLFLHYFDPHYPYEFHKGFPFTSVPFVALPRDRYDSEIAYTDHCIGQVIRKLKDLGLYDSTLLIITADHGDSLGEHSESSHGYFIYHSTLHVPLIIKIPGGPEGVRINDVAGLIDIVPTVCGSLGIAVGPHVQGKDLNALFTGKNSSASQRFIYCESLLPTKYDVGPLLGLVSNRWKYIHTSNPELYDLSKTPLETKNLLAQQTQQTQTMQEQLKLALQNSSGAIADGRVAMDEETRKRLRSLGYVSSRTVDENIQFDQDSLDPKRFIEAYNFMDRFYDLAPKRKFNKAKKLCDKMLRRWPDMKQAHYFLGLIAIEEEDTQATITHFSRYLALAESDTNDFGMRVKSEYDLAVAYGNLGMALDHEGQMERAVANYKKALFYNPNIAEANHNLAGFYLRQGKLSDAVTYFTKTLELDPEMPEAHYGLGNTLLKQGKIEKAIIHYNKAIMLKGDWDDPRRNLEIAQSRKSQIEKNIAFWNESLRENPNQPDVHNNLGTMYYVQENIEKAIYHWKKALELKPDWPVVLNNLAWLLAAKENTKFSEPDEAIRLAESACELSEFKRPEFLATLAVAYAAAGRFDEAVETAEKALALAESANQQQLAEQIQNHLLLYKASQPYTEPLPK